jgi:hypothetical protein
MTPTEIDRAAACIRRVLNQDKTLLLACYSPTDPQFDGVITRVNAALDALDWLVLFAKKEEHEQIR